ncbi:MAG TPA: BREX system ATP-binding domain-containing protein [Gemmatimonadales bacterium]|nr:BREX system ATP-binding domain-containing protein [Gemmatimonadales bacterium]
MSTGLAEALKSRYRLGDEIGRGGMATVYVADDKRHGRRVAVKVLAPELAAVIGADRFLAEIRTTARLQHPHILPLFDSGEASDQLYYVMPYVAGGTLRARLEAEKRLPLDEALGIARAVAAALDYAHREGIIHRDVKPENVLLSDGVPMVADFGVARALNSATEMNITGPGLAVGTPSYMSPEQAAGEANLDARCDVYALGCLLYEMLAGEPPFDGPTPQAILSRIIRDPAPSLRARRGDVSLRLDAAIRRALAKAPADRFQSAGDFAAAIAVGPAGSSTAWEVPQFTTRIDAPFVGRQKELGELLARLDRIADGEGGLTFIGGEPGVGKTRLAEMVLQEARQRGYLCLVGHCYEREDAPPYLPFVEQLEFAARVATPAEFREVLGEGAAEIARIMPGLRQTYPDLPAPLDLPPDQQRHYLFSRYREFAERACRQSPIVALFDDLHWADESTLLLLEHFAPHLAGMPMLVLGTYRDVELDVARPFAVCLERLTRQRHADRITLRRLPEEDVRDLLARLGGSEPPARLVQAVFHETEGNPFFVEEVFQHLNEEGRLFDPAGNWYADLDLSELDVPEGVRLVVGRRLERVSEATRAMLASAAVIGPRFDIGVLEALGETEGDALLDALEEAEAAALIVTRTAGREARFAFAHELIRATLVGSLSLPRRQRKHARIAEVLETLYARSLEPHASELAYHLYQAGAASDPAKTVRFLILAAELGLGATAFDEALAQAERGFSLEEHLSDPDRARLLEIKGAALRGMGRWREVQQPWVEAIAIYERLGDNEAVVRVAVDLNFVQGWMDDIEGLFSFSSRGLAAAGDKPNLKQVLLLGNHAFAAALLGDPDGAMAQNQKAVEVAAALNDPRAIANAAANRVALAWIHGEAEIAVSTAREAGDIRRKLGDRWDLSVLQWMTQRSLVFMGRLEEAAALDDEQASAAEKLGNLGAWLMLDLRRAFADWMQTGNLDRFEAFAKHVTQTWSFAGPWAVFGSLYRCNVLVYRGAPAEAVAELEPAEVRFNNPMWRDAFWGDLFRAKVYAGHPDALSFYERNQAKLPESGRPGYVGGWHAVISCIEGLVMLGERERAAALYPLTRQMIEQGLVTDDYGVTETFAGIAAAAGRQWDQAESHFYEGLRLAGEIPHRLAQPDTRRWHGWMLLERGETGDRARARRLLEEAIAGYREIGMPMHVTICEALIQRTGQGA